MASRFKGDVRAQITVIADGYRSVPVDAEVSSDPAILSDPELAGAENRPDDPCSLSDCKTCKAEKASLPGEKTGSAV